MPTTPIPLRRLLPPLIALSTPAASVFIVLVAVGEVRPGTAFLALLAAIVLLALLLRTYAADVFAIRNYLRDLTYSDQAKVPDRLGTSLGEDMVAGIAQAHRAWVGRASAIGAQLGSSESVPDALPDPLFLLGAQRRLIRANLAARQDFGRDLVGRDLATVLRDPSLLDAVDQVLTGQPGRQVDFSLPALGRDFRARIEPLPQPFADGSSVILALHDMTTVRRMEQMRADFVANASHELRTPLATLLGFVETLQGPARDDAEARERFLGIMREQASRMARLIEDLLSLSRIELNERSQPLDHVDVAAIVRRVAEALELHGGKRGITLRLAIEADLPPVLGQEDELAQVFQNLIENAIKYGRDNSSVEIGVTAAEAPPSGADRFPQGAVVISVRDHGEGIAKEHIPRLTERFFRVDTARSRKLGGTGLGLAIVKHVVNRHRGVLTIDSEVGQGSLFTVYLPAAG